MKYHEKNKFLNLRIKHVSEIFDCLIKDKKRIFYKIDYPKFPT